MPSPLAATLNAALRRLQGDSYAGARAAVNEAATSPWNSRKPPTEAQQRAGNYAKGRAVWHGLKVAIENPAHTTRSGTDPDGKAWSSTMQADYGDITGTRGADGDPVDIFLGPFPESTQVWVLNQLNADRSFDEHKVLAGFTDARHALDCYRLSYTQGWDRFQDPIPCSVPQLKWWLRNADTTRPFALDLLPTEPAMPETQTPELTRVFWDHAAEPASGRTLSDVLYGLRVHDAGDGLLLDAVTMAELLADPEVEQVAVLDALVTMAGRLKPTMAAMMRVMAAAGTEVQPLEMQISEPLRRLGGVHVAALFELSDGQTITIWFHNPDMTPAKFGPADNLVSWKWLLNKKDITIVVAPEKGVDLNTREVARRVMKLAQKNSAAFAKANAKRAETMQILADLKAAVPAKQAQLQGLMTEIEAAKQAQSDALTAEQNAWLATKLDADGVRAVVESMGFRGTTYGLFGKGSTGMVQVWKEGMQDSVKIDITEGMDAKRRKVQVYRALIVGGVESTDLREVLRSLEVATEEGPLRPWLVTNSRGYSAVHKATTMVRAIQAGMISVDYTLPSAEWQAAPQAAAEPEAAFDPATLAVEQTGPSSLWQKITANEYRITAVDGGEWVVARVGSKWLTEAGQSFNDLKAAQMAVEDSIAARARTAAAEAASRATSGPAVEGVPADVLALPEGTYSEWEDKVTTIVEFKEEATRSDAQGMVEAQSFYMQQQWSQGAKAAAAYLAIWGPDGKLARDAGLQRQAAETDEYAAGVRAAADRTKLAGPEVFAEASDEARGLLAIGAAKGGQGAYTTAVAIERNARGMGLSVRWEATDTLPTFDSAEIRVLDSVGSAEAVKVRAIFELAAKDWKAAYAEVDTYGSAKLAEDIRGLFIDFGINSLKKDKPGNVFLGSLVDNLISDFEKAVLGGVSLNKLNAGQDALRNIATVAKKVIDTAWGKGSFDYLKFKNSRASLKGDYSEAKTPTWAKSAKLDKVGYEAKLKPSGATPQSRKVEVNSFEPGDKVISLDNNADLTVTAQRGHLVTVKGKAEPISANRLKLASGAKPKRVTLDAVGLATQFLDFVAEIAKPLLPAEAVLDFAGDVGAAVTTLEIALGVVTDNEPISRAEGNVDQADLQASSAVQFRNAIKLLKGGRLYDAATLEYAEFPAGRMDDATGGLFGTGDSGYIVGTLSRNSVPVAKVHLREDGLVAFKLQGDIASQAAGGYLGKPFTELQEDVETGWRDDWFTVMGDLATATEDLQNPEEAAARQAEEFAAEDKRKAQEAAAMAASEASRAAAIADAQEVGKDKPGFVGAIGDSGGDAIKAALAKKSVGSFVLVAAPGAGGNKWGVAMFSRQMLGKGGRRIDPAGKVGNAQVSPLQETAAEAYASGIQALMNAGGVVLSFGPVAAAEPVAGDAITIGSVALVPFTQMSRAGTRVWGVRVVENGKEFNAADGSGSWFKSDTKANMVADLTRSYESVMKIGDKTANENRWRENFDLPPLPTTQAPDAPGTANEPNQPEAPAGTPEATPPADAGSAGAEAGDPVATSAPADETPGLTQNATAEAIAGNPAAEAAQRSMDLLTLNRIATGVHPDMLEPELAELIETILNAYPDDVEVQANGERAITAYSNGLMAATV